MAMASNGGTGATEAMATRTRASKSGTRRGVGSGVGALGVGLALGLALDGRWIGVGVLGVGGLWDWALAVVALGGGWTGVGWRWCVWVLGGAGVLRWLVQLLLLAPARACDVVLGSVRISQSASKKCRANGVVGANFRQCRLNFFPLFKRACGLFYCFFKKMLAKKEMLGNIMRHNHQSPIQQSTKGTTMNTTTTIELSILPHGEVAIQKIIRDENGEYIEHETLTIATTSDFLPDVYCDCTAEEMRREFLSDVDDLLKEAGDIPDDIAEEFRDECEFRFWNCKLEDYYEQRLVNERDARLAKEHYAGKEA